MRDLTLNELVEKLVSFIILNRKNKAFEGWPEDKIRLAMRQAMYNQSLLWCSNETGQIVGVVFGDANHLNKSFYVVGILTTDPRAIKQFVVRFDQMFPGYSLEGWRMNGIRYYNTPKLISRLLTHK